MTGSKRSLSHGICRCCWLDALFTRVAMLLQVGIRGLCSMLYLRHKITPRPLFKFQLRMLICEHFNKGWWCLHRPATACMHSAQGFEPLWAVVLLWFHYKLFLSDLHLHQYCLKLHWCISCGKKNECWMECAEDVSEGALPGRNASLSHWPAVQFAVRSPGANPAQRKALTHLCCRQWHGWGCSFIFYTWFADCQLAE